MKWILSEIPPADFLNSHPELPPIVARLLWNRNLRTQEQIDEFMNPDYVSDIHDPFLFNEMGSAVKIIFEAIKNKQTICVHGDYDADGVSAAAILINTLRKLGAEKVTVFIPHREIDGYGLNPHTVEYLKQQGTDLIITCDCGISNTEEIKQAQSLGMKIIVTDHHTVPTDRPPADAIVHPKVPGEKYPDKGLAGAAVAFKLAQALLKTYQTEHETLPDGEKPEAFEKWMLDLVAIATIGDMVPLIGESRTLARYGLIVLNKTRNLGLRELLKISGMADENGNPKKNKFDAGTIGFQIVPRINAAGRMDHANAAYELLATSDPDEAKILAAGLNQNNIDRQKLTDDIVSQAKKQVIETKQTENPILFAYGESWPAGILGLVAGRLKDFYYKPAFALAKVREDKNDPEKTGPEIVGSGRSVEEFNIIQTLQSMPEMFIKYGGHPQACGLSLKEENFETWKTKMMDVAKKELIGVELVPQVKVDAEVALEDVDWKLYDLLQRFEPFGVGNEEPKYAAYGLSVVSVNPVGQNGNHLRLMVKHNSHKVRKTIAFGFGNADRHPSDWGNTLKPGDKINLAFSISVNEWNGNRELELKIEDIERA